MPRAEAMGDLLHLMGSPTVTCAMPASLGDAGRLAMASSASCWLPGLRPPPAAARDRRGALRVRVQLHGAALLPEYSALGVVRQPAGAACPASRRATSTPTDGQVVIGGNGSIRFQRLMTAIGQPALAAIRPRHNPGRAARVAELDSAIGAWTAQRSVREVVSQLQGGAGFPVSRIYTARDTHRPHYKGPRYAPQSHNRRWQGSGWCQA